MFIWSIDNYLKCIKIYNNIITNENTNFVNLSFIYLKISQIFEKFESKNENNFFNTTNLKKLYYM